ncbi:response regulator [bacterium]|nr:response regulator [bacterium]
MKRLLFVDDEPNLLAGLRRMLRSERNEWEMEFAEGGEEALSKLQSHRADVVISDMRMPRMDGAEFLNEVQQRQPATARICLSGFSDGGLIMRGLGSIHQYLNKPCESGHLIQTVRNILQAAAGLPAELHERLCALKCLPVAQLTLQHLKEVLAQDAPCLQEVGQLANLDLGLSCRLLQLVHSGFFGTPRHVESVEDACRLLGIAKLRKLVELPDVFSSQELDQQWLARLGRAADRLSRRAFSLAKENGLSPRECDYARLAGILYGLPELACAACGWPEVVNESGLFLIRLWGLPNQVVDPELAPAAQVALALDEGEYDASATR